MGTWPEPLKATPSIGGPSSTPHQPGPTDLDRGVKVKGDVLLNLAGSCVVSGVIRRDHVQCTENTSTWMAMTVPITPAPESMKRIGGRQRSTASANKAATAGVPAIA